MADFKNLNSIGKVHYGSSDIQCNDAVDYWKAYNRRDSIQIIKEYGPITDIKVSHQLVDIDEKKDGMKLLPVKYGISNSMHIHLFDGLTKKSDRLLSKFHRRVCQLSFRPTDSGRLLAAGGEEGHIKVLDTINGALLRTFKVNNSSSFDKCQSMSTNPLTSSLTTNNTMFDNMIKGSSKALEKKRQEILTRTSSMTIRALSWLDNGQRLCSGSDDGSLRIWDIQTENIVDTYEKCHNDRVQKCLVPNTILQQNLIFTASYDGLVKMFDRRIDMKSSVFSLEHKIPVEDIAILPNSNLLYSCGGESIFVWDIMNGGQLMREMSNHRATIKSILLHSDNSHTSSTSSFLLSGALDMKVNIYDTLNYQLISSFKESAPISTMAFLPHSCHCSLITGMTDGHVSVRKRVQLMDQYPKADKAEIYSSKFTKNYNGERMMNVDLQIGTNKLTQKYDKIHKFLKRFELSKALKYSLVLYKKKPDLIVHLIYELLRRQQIGMCMQSLQLKYFYQLILFFRKYLFHPNYTIYLIDSVKILLSVFIKNFVNKTKKFPNDEEEYENLLMKCHRSMNALTKSFTNKLAAGNESFKVIGQIDLLLL
ncbi:hypothetical protein SNEBB_002677 [Seison nebaliae]|nr:hypothetical protein SNEBB_002677 [Seison nebaliae]